jgi:hypothetical protein
MIEEVTTRNDAQLLGRVLKYFIKVRLRTKSTQLINR